MKNMTYEDALLEVQLQAENQQDNYLIIKMDWDQRLVLPHRAGMLLMEALNQAEQLMPRYGKENLEILPIEMGKIEIQTMPRSLYQHIKVANLLKVPSHELKAPGETDEPAAG